MNIYVCIKQVPDTETKIKLNGDSTGIDTTGIKWIMSPYDELAVEEALRLKEKNAGSTVTVSLGWPGSGGRDDSHRACHGRRQRNSCRACRKPPTTIWPPRLWRARSKKKPKSTSFSRAKKPSMTAPPR